MDNHILSGDNLQWMQQLESESYQLIYTDPPFNTGKRQKLARKTTTEDAEGDRTGFGGRRYTTTVGQERGYDDSFDDFLGFLEPRVREMRRLLAPTGVLYLHLDWRWVHDVKVRVLDEVFGRDAFISELIWAYDYGAKPKTRWPQKHDTILVYAKDPKLTPFYVDQVEREPYMAPGMVSKEKAERGKLPVSVLWHTIVATNGKERTGYPTQKPMGVVRRFLQAHTVEGDRCLDPFGGSGTLGAIASEMNRPATVIDQNPEAIEVMSERLGWPVLQLPDADGTSA